MLKKIRLPAEIILYVMIVYFYSEYMVSREVSNYIMWPSTIVILYLTWYVLQRITKTILKLLGL